MEEKFQRDEERRQAEVDKKAASNSLDRGAYVLASKLNEEKMRATNEFFSKNQNAANLLNTTLLMSEQSKSVVCGESTCADSCYFRNSRSHREQQGST